MDASLTGFPLSPSFSWHREPCRPITWTLALPRMVWPAEDRLITQQSVKSKTEQKEPKATSADSGKV